MAKTIRTTPPRVGVFLIELIVAIGFFAMASAVCMQVFAQASIISKESEDLSQAMLYAQSAAEVFKFTGGDLQATAEILEGNLDGNRMVISYNHDWQRHRQDGDAACSLVLTQDEHDGVVTGNILVSRGEKPVFQLQVMTLSA